MTYTPNEMSTNIVGIRLKEQIKANEDKQEVIAAYLNYSKTTISRYCTGKEKLPIQAAQKLAKRWDIRVEYLLGKDDFKTDLELLNYAQIEDHENFIIQKRYLQTLGIDMQLTYRITCHYDTIYKNKEYLLPYLREDSYCKIINDTDFNLPYKEFVQKKKMFCSLNLLRPLDDEIFKECSVIGKNTTFEDSPQAPFGITSYALDAQNSPIKENVVLSVGFEVFNQGKYIGIYDVTEIQQALKIIDKYTRFSIETFLFKDY